MLLRVAFYLPELDPVCPHEPCAEALLVASVISSFDNSTVEITSSYSFEFWLVLFTFFFHPLSNIYF